MPDANPRALGFLITHHSMAIHAHAAAEAATMVVVNASAALELAASALPALNPNHPNHSSPTPRTVMVRLWGTNRSLG